MPLNEEGKKSSINGSCFKGGPGNKTFDIAVIGAGPAGSLAAALSAKAGFSVVLIEKEFLPRAKPCGGLLSNRALKLLPFDFVLPPSLFSPVERIVVVKNLRSYSCEPKEPAGLIVKRSEFDHLLALYAADQGVTIAEGWQVGAVRPGEFTDRNGYILERKEKGSGKTKFSARYVICAWGVSGKTLKKCFSLKKIKVSSGRAIVASCSKPCPDKFDGTASFYPLPKIGGMGWAFCGPGFLNCGVGGLAGYDKLKNRFDQLFPEAKNFARPDKWPLPFAGPILKCGAGNHILIGDAAGLVDPFSGEGLHNSFLSAILAVEAITAAKAYRGAAGDIYNRLFKSHFRNKFAGAMLLPILLHSAFAFNPARAPGIIASLMDKGCNA